MNETIGESIIWIFYQKIPDLITSIEVSIVKLYSSLVVSKFFKIHLTNYISKLDLFSSG